MLIYINKFHNMLKLHHYVRVNPQSLSWAMLSFASLPLPHPQNQLNPEPLSDTVYHILTLLQKPNWENSYHLKSLVSHMDPHSATQIISHHCTNVRLSLQFFNWVCRHSTYCYDLDKRIHLINLLLANKFYNIVHKALVFIIKDSCTSENELSKVIDAIEDMRAVGFRLNYPCYSILLMCLAKLKMSLSAFWVYRKMVEDGFVLGVIDYRALINALCKNGFVNAGEMFLSRVLRLGFALDAHICTSLVLGYCKVGELTEAFRVFDAMTKKDTCHANSVTYSVLMHGLCEVGRVEDACKLKEEMIKRGCEPSTRTYTVLIKAVCDTGFVGKAYDLLDEMVKKGCEPNVHTYTVLIDMLCREGKIEEANGMFRKMLKDGLYPSVVSYNVLINGYCKEGRVISAFELLGLMERRRCRPNIRTYNELMEGLCKVDRPFKAMELLRKVIDIGLCPNEITYNILVYGFCTAGQLDMAVNILSSMDAIGAHPDRFTYSAILDGLCKEGKLELANGVLGVMVRKGITIDEVTITSFISGCCNLGRTKDALVLFEGMIKDGCLTSPHAFNSLLNVFSKHVRSIEGSAMFGKMIKLGIPPSVVTFTILIDSICRAGDVIKSLESIEFMKQAGCEPNVYTYTVVIKSLCQNGKIEEAECLLLKMSNSGVSPNQRTYAILVKSLVKAGRLYSAFEIVSSMIQSGCQPNDHVYLALLFGLLLLDKASVEGGICSFGDLGSELSVNGENDVNSFSSIIFREIDISHALQLRDRIGDCGGSLVDVYNFLVSGLCQVGRISEADHLIRGMMKLGIMVNNAICSCMIEHFCRDKNYDYCLEWMRIIYDNGRVPSFASCCSVILGLREAGKLKEAEWLVSNFLRYADDENQTLASPYLEFLVKGDEPHKCFELLNLIGEVRPKERPII